MDKSHITFRSPGMIWGLVIFVLWLVCWIILMPFLPKAQILGIPLITWSQILLGVFAIVISIVAIFQLEQWEKS